jgi:hypothetical protein
MQTHYVFCGVGTEFLNVVCFEGLGQGVFESSSLMIIFGAKREEEVGTGGTCRMGSFVIHTNQAL